MLFNRKAQSTAEYAIIIGVVVGAIMAVGVFLRGGIEYKVRDMTNQYLEQGGEPTRFKTAVMDSNYETASVSQSDVKQNKELGTGSEILVGGGVDAATAETLGKTERRGKTTYFEQ